MDKIFLEILSMELPISVSEWELAANKILPPEIYDFIAGGAGEEIGKQENFDALDRLKLVSRVLRGNSTADTSTNRFCKITKNSFLPAPLFIAPTAHHRLVCANGEKATAAASSTIGVPYILSSMSDCDIEDVSSCTRGLLCQQLYIAKDRSETVQKIQRAESSGVSAFVLTVDVPSMGNRLRDRRNGFMPHADHLNRGIEGESKLAKYVKNTLEPALEWNDISWVREQTSLPIILKGILHPDDAALAIDYGVDALYISNHGGRQLDHHVSPFSVLPALVNKTQNCIPIIVDGGISSGIDIFKALALGADAVGIGRPALWALATKGQAGLEHLLIQLIGDLKRTMHICGCANVQEISRNFIWVSDASV